MPKREKRPRDVNQLAKLIGDIATGQAPEPAPDTRNQAAVALGSKGGAARASKMTPKQRSKAASKAAKGRWAKHKKGDGRSGAAAR